MTTTTAAPSDVRGRRTALWSGLVVAVLSLAGAARFADMISV